MAGSRVKKTNVVDKIACNKCEKELVVKNNFYQTNSKFFQIKGLLPVCKNCLQKYYDELLEEYDNEPYLAIVDFFRTFDLYFNDELYEMSLKERETRVKKGNKMIPPHWKIMIGKLNSLSRYNNLTWKDCKGADVYSVDKIESDSLEILTTKDRMILKEKWGDNYNDKELLSMEKFYDSMLRAYRIETPQHIKSLSIMTKMQKKMDDYLEEGDMVNFEKVSKVYSKTMTDSGLRPIDKKSSADSSGLVNFSNLYEAIERDGFIKPSPIVENQDIIDETIKYLLNYNLEILEKEKLIEAPFDTPKVDKYINDEDNGDENELQ